MITRRIFKATIKVCAIKVVDNQPTLIDHPDIVLYDTKPSLDAAVNKTVAKTPGLTLMSVERSDDYYAISVADFVAHGTTENVPRSPAQRKNTAE